MSAPAVSVLMAVYNGAPWVADAARSVLAQTLGDLELVVVDDGSTDATGDVLAGVGDSRLRVERREHEGLTRALNYGLRVARAPLVARLDADDIALPERLARQVDEYYRVLAPGGHIAILDTPNRWFPLETHSVGLPLVQFFPAPVAYRYARLLRRRAFGDVPYAEFVADGTGWRNATLAECLPSRGADRVQDVTEAAGYGWRFFRNTARSRVRRALLPLFAVTVAALRAAGQSPSLCLPYLNLLFQWPR